MTYTPEQVAWARAIVANADATADAPSNAGAVVEQGDSPAESSPEPPASAESAPVVEAAVPESEAAEAPAEAAETEPTAADVEPVASPAAVASEPFAQLSAQLKSLPDAVSPDEVSDVLGVVVKLLKEVIA